MAAGLPFKLALGVKSMNESLAFVQPWMALLSLSVLVVACAHKRLLFRHSQNSSAIRKFLIPVVVHFIPAIVAWFFIVMVGVRLLAEENRPVSGFISQVTFFAGFYVLAGSLIGKELRGLRRDEPKW